MAKIAVEQYELSKNEIDMLLVELKDKGITNAKELQRYLKGYAYMKDTARKCHLLISPNDKKESFALPYD